MTTSEYLIQQAFPKANDYAVKQLLEQTGNPELALQILLGIQDDNWDICPKNVRLRENVGNTIELTPIAFDPWTTEVTYTYMFKFTRFGKEPNSPLSDCVYGPTAHHSHQIEFEERQKSSMLMEEWFKLKVKTQ